VNKYIRTKPRVHNQKYPAIVTPNMFNAYLSIHISDMFIRNVNITIFSLAMHVNKHPFCVQERHSS